MSQDNPNPFDQLGIDPRLGPQELTALLRQKAERALPEERKRLQGLWRKLTLKESDRIRWAFLAHPRAQGTSNELDALIRKIPPHFSRFKLPAIIIRLCDALVLPHESRQDRIPIRPPSFFQRED